MATNKNITMKQFNGVDYDTLYPKTIASQIDDVYSKDETSNLFLPKAGGSMGGILDMNGNRITNLPSPSTPSEPATKEYVDGINDNVLNKFSIDKEISIVAYSSSTLVGTGTLKNVNCGCIVEINNTVSNSTVARIYRNNGANAKGNPIVPAIYSGSYNFYISFYNDDKPNNYIPNFDKGGIYYSAYYLRTFSLYIPFWCN